MERSPEQAPFGWQLWGGPRGVRNPLRPVRVEGERAGERGPGGIFASALDHRKHRFGQRAQTSVEGEFVFVLVSDKSSPVRLGRGNDIECPVLAVEADRCAHPRQFEVHVPVRTPVRPWCALPVYADNGRSEPLVLNVRTVPVLKQDEPAVRTAPDTCPSPHSRSEGTCDRGKILIVKENESCDGETNSLLVRSKRSHATEHDGIARSPRVMLNNLDKTGLTG